MLPMACKKLRESYFNLKLLRQIWVLCFDLHISVSEWLECSPFPIVSFLFYWWYGLIEVLFKISGHMQHVVVWTVAFFRGRGGTLVTFKQVNHFYTLKYPFTLTWSLWLCFQPHSIQPYTLWEQFFLLFLCAYITWHNAYSTLYV